MYKGVLKSPSFLLYGTAAFCKQFSRCWDVDGQEPFGVRGIQHAAVMQKKGLAHGGGHIEIGYILGDFSVADKWLGHVCN